MRSRRHIVLFGSALLFGIALGVLPGPSLSHAADARDNAKNQGKAGDQCNTHNDCQNSPVRLRCVPTGESDKKECRLAPHPPVT